MIRMESLSALLRDNSTELINAGAAAESIMVIYMVYTGWMSQTQMPVLSEELMSNGLFCTPINQSINVFNVLGGNWDPTDKKFSSVNSYRQDLLPTCKAFPKETTTCIWFTQSHKICNGTTVLQEA